MPIRLTMSEFEVLIKYVNFAIDNSWIEPLVALKKLRESDAFQLTYVRDELHPEKFCLAPDQDRDHKVIFKNNFNSAYRVLT